MRIYNIRFEKKNIFQDDFIWINNRLFTEIDTNNNDENQVIMLENTKNDLITSLTKSEEYSSNEESKSINLTEFGFDFAVEKYVREEFFSVPNSDESS